MKTGTKIPITCVKKIEYKRSKGVLGGDGKKRSVFIATANEIKRKITKIFKASYKVGVEDWLGNCSGIAFNVEFTPLESL